jgi:hypothetical protein
MAMVQAASYNFSTVENPLSDGGLFTAINDALFTIALKVIAGNFCEAVSTGANAGTFYPTIAAPGNVWPADHYSELTLTTFSNTASFADLMVRQGSATSGTQYIASLNRGAQQWSLFAVVSGTVHTLVNAQAQASAQGDVFRLTVVGNVLTLNRNGSQVQTFTDASNFIVSGSPGFSFNSAVAITNVQTSLWAAGANQAATPTFSPNGGSFSSAQTVTITSASGGTIYYTTDGSTPTHASSSISSGGTISVGVTSTVKAIASATNNVDSTAGSAAFTITIPVASHYSQPDCRDYSIFPNTAVSVNGTLTYTTPMHPSVTPPTDSRTGKPVASGTYPQNSRAPGTFGPGE